MYNYQNQKIVVWNHNSINSKETPLTLQNKQIHQKYSQIIWKSKKTITETQENLNESVNTQRDDSSVISSKIKTVEEEAAKSQAKINEHIKLEKKIEQSIEELW